MRGVLEQIVAHPTGVDPATLSEVQRYTKLFWINNGPYNNLTARKFVLQCTPQAFAAAAKASASAGGKLATGEGESLDALLTRLQPMFFDPDVDPIVTNKNPVRQGHPALQRQQPLRRRLDARPEGVCGEIRPQLAPGEVRRHAR